MLNDARIVTAAPLPKLRPERLTASGCISAPTPIRGLTVRDWIAAAAGAVIIAGLTIAALVVLP